MTLSRLIIQSSMLLKIKCSLYLKYHLIKFLGSDSNLKITGFRSGDETSRGQTENVENGLPACDSEEVINTRLAGGKVVKDAWMYDGDFWSKLAPMSMKRDRPACSLAYKDGSVS